MIAILIEEEKEKREEQEHLEEKGIAFIQRFSNEFASIMH